MIYRLLRLAYFTLQYVFSFCQVLSWVASLFLFSPERDTSLSICVSGVTLYFLKNIVFASMP